MNKMRLILAGTLGSILLFGGITSFAESESLEPLYAIEKPMGMDNVNLVVDIMTPEGKGYFLNDNGKYVKIPHSGDTLITHVTPFLYLTAFGYPHDFLVIERDRKDKSIVYVNVYNYFQGNLTKVTSIKSEPVKNPESDIHIAHENGFYVYFNEHINHELVSSTAYVWDYESKTYKKAGVLSK